MTDWNLIYIAQNATKIFRSIRWPNGPICPSCRSGAIRCMHDGRYKCLDCGKVFSEKSDTLFHGSHLPISFWMMAIYLDITAKGISSYELSRKLQITQKAAYYMLIRLRTALSQDDIYLDSELVAHDEVFIGGDFRNFCLSKRQALIEKFNLPRRPRCVSEKIALGNAINARTKRGCFGITDGKLCILKQVATPIRQSDIIDIYTKHVSPNGLAVADCSYLYKDWEKLTGRELHTNNHSKRQFIADNGTSSNMIENVFSWLERTNSCTYVHYSRKYTQLYLNEFAFRYNTRKMSIQDKMTKFIEKCLRRYDRDILVKLNSMENELYRTKDFFNPDEFFKKHRGLIKQYSEGGLVYRLEDYI